MVTVVGALPFQFLSGTKSTSTIRNFIEPNQQLQNFSINTSEQPSVYVLGLSAIIGAQYYLSESFSLGINISNSFNFSWQNGTYGELMQVFDASGQMINEETDENNVNIKRYYLDYNNISLSLYYTLPLSAE